MSRAANTADERPRRWRRLRPVVLLLAAVPMVGGLYVLGGPDHLPLRTLRLSGELSHVTPSELRQALAPHARAGFVRFDAAAARSALERLPWVAAASVRRAWPDVLAVEIIEQQAMARWEAGGLVNTQGELFFPVEGALPADLPLLSGPEGSVRTVLAGYRMAQRSLDGIGRGIVAVAMDARRSWRLQLEGGLDVIAGRQDIEARLARFARAFDNALSERGEAIERVDLRYTNGFAVRWRENQAQIG